jgi:ABC-type uncharacterized transport system substrate-binding protein
MREKIFTWLLAGFLLSTVSLAEAQPAKNFSRVGFLSPRAGPSENEEAFRQGLRKLGYVEGGNFAIEWRFADGKAERFAELAAELVRLKLNAIVVGGGSAAPFVKKETRSIPIIFTSMGDPVGSGLVMSLARPGENVTGLTMDAPGLIGKRLELLIESFPRTARVAVLYDLSSLFWKQNLKEAEQAAHLLKVRVQAVGVRNSDDLESAFLAIIKERAEALVKFPSAVLTSYRKRIVELAAKHRLPAVYEDRIIAEDGGLMSYGTDISDLYRRAAIYVDKILKGTKPADLPVEQPTKFELVINLKAAKQIGVTIPPNVLVRADKVIK